MLLKHLFITAANGLKAHRSRSALTILGIVIGITAIIIMMSVGQGAKNLILNQIRGLGSQTIAIEPGAEPKGFSDLTQIFTDSLKQKDVESLKMSSNVRGLKEISPNVVQVATVASANEAIRVNIIGTAPAIAEILDLYPSQGRFFDEEDVKEKSNVVVVGSDVKTDLFGKSDALGQNLKIKGMTFKIIGVIAPKGQVSLFNIDKIVAIPYTTAQKYLFGINYFNSIIVEAESGQNIQQAVEEIKLTLRQNHNITDPSKDDFHVMTQAEVAQRAGAVTNILTALLVSIAAISLVVGGIGIMNIMIVAVTERTREIGLRKAIGATEKDILMQFLFEALMLTGVGGIIGVVLGAGFSYLAAFALSKIVSSAWTFSFPFSAAALGLFVSSVIGLIFGLYPARRASIKNPIEALRYE